MANHRNPGLIAATAAAALAVGATAACSSDPSALANWTAQPTEPDLSVAADAQVECDGHVSELHEVEEFGVPDQTVVVEQRGEVTAVVLVGDTSHGYCLSLPSDTFAGVGTTPEIDADRMIDVVAAPRWNGRTITAQLLVGVAQPGVEEVRVRTSDGQQITASLSAGWFVAWWPADIRADSVRALDAGGQTVGIIENLPRAPEEVPSPMRR
jgi:hypothetical protein